MNEFYTSFVQNTCCDHGNCLVEGIMWVITYEDICKKDNYLETLQKLITIIIIRIKPFVFTVK